jgi:glutamine phosphoribosylpyrophosphate amidotransferase
VAKLIAALRQVDRRVLAGAPTEDKRMIGVRDPYGFRPLVIGRLKDSYVLSSETSSFDLIEAEYIRDVEPGEIVVIDERGDQPPSSPRGASTTGSACSSTCTSRAPTAWSTASRCTGPASAWARGWRSSSRSRPTW